MSDVLIVQFPGQGGYDDEAIVAARSVLRQHDALFARIDAAAAAVDPTTGSVTETVFASRPPTLETLRRDAPDLLQLSIYALSVVTFEALRSRGLRDMTEIAMTGHSFGEIAALTCAGAFTVEQGAELVSLRNTVLRAHADRPGVMAAVAAPVDHVRSMLALVARDDVVVAADNAPEQTVVSGSDEGVAAVGRVAEALGLTFMPLAAPYAFHSPLLSPLVAPLRERLRGVRQQPLQARVYSPVLGRWYEDGDRLTDALAASLDRPVRYREAVLALREHGATTFVETGARGVLSSFVRRTAPDATTVRCLSGRDAGTFPDSQLAALGRPVGSAADPAVLRALLPDVDVTRAESFWRERGHRVLAAIQAEFSAHHGAQASAPTDLRQDAHGAAPMATATVRLEAGAPPSRDELFAELRAFYAEALEYPEEVFSEDVELEADLGVDSVKQTELLARLADRYGLPQPSEDFRLADYRTMGRVVDFVADARTEVDLPGPTAAATMTPSAVAIERGAGAADAAAGGTAGASHVGRDELFAELRAFYAEALEYPEEVFSEDVELEADLGVDSVKQTELLARLADRYGLPQPSEDFRLADYRTMGRVVDFVADAGRVMATAA